MTKVIHQTTDYSKILGAASVILFVIFFLLSFATGRWEENTLLPNYFMINLSDRIALAGLTAGISAAILFSKEKNVH